MESGIRLAEGQLVNHFTNHSELTRKDLLVRNVKRYRREVEKSHPGMLLFCDNYHIDYLFPEFLPTTYILPSDYNLFVEEFRKNPSSVWIMRPPDKARGIGIFIINRLSQIKKWAAQSKISYSTPTTQKDSYVVSKYIENPFLIGVLLLFYSLGKEVRSTTLRPGQIMETIRSLQIRPRLCSILL
jgi:tubulin polyglutamylase TTLL1